jgi:hypothetical protein
MPVSSLSELSVRWFPSAAPIDHPSATLRRDPDAVIRRQSRAVCLRRLRRNASGGQSLLSVPIGRMRVVEQIGILTLAASGRTDRRSTRRLKPWPESRRCSGPLPDGALRMILEASLRDLLKSGRRPVSRRGF